MDNLNYGKNLTILRNLNGNPLVYCLLHGETRENFLGELYASEAECNLLSYLSELIVRDENALSVTLAKGNPPSAYVTAAFADDIKSIFAAAEEAAEKYGGFDLGAAKYGLDAFSSTDFLSEFYCSNGYGIFIGNKAFTYDGEGLAPVRNPAKTRLSELKDYESEKKTLIFNVESMLGGAPFFNTLLYGDRGTGKSSTVQAILNEYADKGLRLIQLDKKYLDKLPEVRDIIAGNPLKFIIFIDDLSLTQDSPALSAFKAALEGSVNCSENSMVIATSNRRHIIRENYSDRQNDLHPDDAIQDVTSLADRFALTIMFSTTDKNKYLSIVSQLAKDAGIYSDGLLQLAERWALLKGGRSPRAAKQFCDFALSCVSQNRDIDF